MPQSTKLLITMLLEEFIKSSSQILHMKSANSTIEISLGELGQWTIEISLGEFGQWIIEISLGGSGQWIIKISLGELGQ